MELVAAGKKSLEELIKLVDSEIEANRRWTRRVSVSLKSSKLGDMERRSSSARESVLWLTQVQSRSLDVSAQAETELLNRVLKTLTDLKEKFGATGKLLLSEQNRIDKELKDAALKLDKAQSRYIKCCDEEHIMKLQLAEARREKSKTEEQLILMQDRSTTKLKELIKCSDAYVEAIKNVRTLRANYDFRLKKILDAFQQLEEERLETMKECYLAYMRVTIEKHRLIAAEHEAVLEKVTEIFDPLKDIRTFISETQTDKVPDPLPRFEAHFADPTINQDEFFRRRSSTIVQDEKSTERLHLEKAFHSYFEFILARSDDSTEDFDWGRYRRVDSLLKSEEGRHALSAVLNDLRTRNSGDLRSRRRYEDIGHIMRLCLDYIVRHVSQSLLDSADSDLRNSVVPAKTIMIISQTLYYFPDSEKSERLYLQDLIHDHPIWKDMSFWEEMFFESVFEEVRRKRVATIERWMTDEEQTERKSANCNVVFGQLSSFTHSMILFGLSKEMVSEFVFKLSRLHDLDESHVSMLTSLIQNEV